MTESTPRRVLLARFAVGLLAVPAMMLLGSGAASAVELTPIAEAVDETVQITPIAEALDETLAGVTGTATGAVGDVTGQLPDLDDVTGSLPGAGDLPTGDLPTGDLPDVGGLVGGLTGDLPVVGGLLGGLDDAIQLDATLDLGVSLL